MKTLRPWLVRVLVALVVLVPALTITGSGASAGPETTPTIEGPLVLPLKGEGIVVGGLSVELAPPPFDLIITGPSIAIIDGTKDITPALVRMN
jgi:hypothetical protein